MKTNFSDDIPNVYHNDGDGTFEDRVLQSGLGAYMQYVGWGVHLIDVDHDGRREMLMVNGHVYPEAERPARIAAIGSRGCCTGTSGTAGSRTSPSESGPGIRDAWSSRGSAAGDLDNDGALEVVVSNMGARPSLLKNFGPRKNWLLVRCVGTRASNRDADRRARVGVRRRSPLVGRGAGRRELPVAE